MGPHPIKNTAEGCEHHNEGTRALTIILNNNIAVITYCRPDDGRGEQVAMVTAGR